METDKVFVGAVPAVYDRHLGPILFQPYARVVAERLGKADRDILETAAGTGIVTRAMAAAVPESRILATDLNQAMLDVAAAQATAGDVRWQRADAQSLPFESGAYDAVVCCFGMMFMPDKQAAYREARRVLRAGGRYLFTVWDRIGTNPVMEIAETTLAGLFPHDPPRFFSRTPCGYHDRARIEADLRQAGYTTIRIEVVQRETDVVSAREAAIGCCQGTPLRGEIETRDPGGLARATEAVAGAMRARYGDGAFRSPLQALVVTAS